MKLVTGKIKNKIYSPITIDDWFILYSKFEYFLTYIFC